MDSSFKHVTYDIKKLNDRSEVSFMLEGPKKKSYATFCWTVGIMSFVICLALIRYFVAGMH